MTDDRVVLHVEVATEEAANVKETYNILEKMEKKLYNLKGQRKKFFENPELFNFGSPVKPEEDKGPIFRGEQEAEGVATAVRPGKKGQAIQRQDAFKSMQNAIDDIEQKQATMFDELQQLSPFLILSGSKGPSSILNIIKPIIPYIGEALLAIGFIEKVYEMLFMPGGPFDRRFKLVISKLVAPLVNRILLANIRQAFKELRISSWIGPKGNNRGQVGTTLAGFAHGRPVYDEKLEMLTKDLY
jgi:hypothetical protein